MRVRMIFLVQTLGAFLFCCASLTFGEYTPLFPCQFGSREQQHSRLGLRHIQAGGIGYGKGYTTLETFFSPSPEVWSWIPFLDLRGHVFK
jgi:hypothetical protein